VPREDNQCQHSATRGLRFAPPVRLDHVIRKNKMNMVSANKRDLSACNNLLRASDEEVEEKLIEHLEWVQDINWPVASRVFERLKDIGDPLIEPVKSIHRGNDENWKYWVISELLRRAPNRTVCALKNELENIVNNPTEGEKAEEVNIVAREVLAKCQ
jgi:hypothetical protein